MMSYIALSDEELDALNGVDYVLTCLYITLKRYMDYDTLIVGYKRKISYQSLSEALYIEPRQGVRGGSPHKSSIRRMIDQLVKIGLIAKSRKDTLVFKLKMCDTDFYGQNKGDTKPTRKADTPNTAPMLEFGDICDTPKTTKADTPQYLNNNINKSSSSNIDTLYQSDTPIDDDDLIYPKKLSNSEIEQIAPMLKKISSKKDAQKLLDELAWKIHKGVVRASRVMFFSRMVDSFLAGNQIFDGADYVAKARENMVAAELAKKTQAKNVPRDDVAIAAGKKMLDKLRKNRVSC